MRRLPQLDRLNVFRPFEHVPDHHEDRMTRAAMIVLRLVPHALEAFLGIARRNLHGRADLPAGALDGPIRRGQPSIVGTQRARIAGVGDGAEDGDERLPVLLSVFLTPDAHVEFDSLDVHERVRGQRLDGLVEFTDLVVAIESKSRKAPRAARASGSDLTASRLSTAPWSMSDGRSCSLSSWRLPRAGC